MTIMFSIDRSKISYLSESNPMYFPHKKVDSIHVQFESRRYPQAYEFSLVRLAPNTGDGEFLVGRHWYNTLVRIMQQESQSVGQDVAFELQQFDEDMSMFAIKMDENSIGHDVDTIKQSGNLRVAMSFRYVPFYIVLHATKVVFYRTQIAELTNVYIWMVYKSNVMCSADRIFQLDYNPGSHQ